MPTTPYGFIPPWMRELGGTAADVFRSGASGVGELGRRGVGAVQSGLNDVGLIGGSALGAGMEAARMGGNAVQRSAYDVASDISEIGPTLAGGSLPDVARKITGYGSAYANPAAAIGRGVEAMFQPTITGFGEEIVPPGYASIITGHGEEIPPDVSPQNPPPTAAPREVPDPQVVAQMEATNTETHPAARNNRGTTMGDSANLNKPTFLEQPKPSYGPMTMEGPNGLKATVHNSRALTREGGYGQAPASLRRNAYGSTSTRTSPAGTNIQRSPDGPGEKTYRGSHWDNYADTSGYQQEIDHGVREQRESRYANELRRIQEQTALTDPRRAELAELQTQAEMARARALAKDPFGIEVERQKYGIREGAIQERIDMAERNFTMKAQEAMNLRDTGKITEEGFEQMLDDLKADRDAEKERWLPRGNWDVSRRGSGYP